MLAVVVVNIRLFIIILKVHIILHLLCEDVVFLFYMHCLSNGFDFISSQLYCCFKKEALHQVDTMDAVTITIKKPFYIKNIHFNLLFLFSI